MTIVAIVVAIVRVVRIGTVVSESSSSREEWLWLLLMREQSIVMLCWLTQKTWYYCSSGLFATVVECRASDSF